jgi:Tetratricopeptide repeat
MWSFSKLQTWDWIGLWVEFDPGTGNLLWVGVEPRGTNPWVDYSTPNGIQFGSRREDVMSAIGPPERTVTSGGLTSLYYDRRGIRLTLTDSGPYAGEVRQIRIVWPSVPRGDSLIVPGRRISNIEVGMPEEHALALLGGGYLRANSSPGFHLYYWPHLGLGFMETSGYVTSVRAARVSPSDGAGIRYATKEEISLGASMSDIREVLGEPSGTVLLRGGSRSWIYDSRGLAFTLDKRQKVATIDVSRAHGTIADFDKAIELDPNDAYAYYSRGLAYEEKGDLDRAIADFAKLIELNPKYAPAYNDRGLAERRAIPTAR